MAWRDRVHVPSVLLAAGFAAGAIALFWWLGPYAARAWPLLIGWLLLYVVVAAKLLGD